MWSSCQHDFEFGSDFVDNVAHEIEVPPWINHDAHMKPDHGPHSGEDVHRGDAEPASGAHRKMLLPDAASSLANLQATLPSSSSRPHSTNHLAILLMTMGVTGLVVWNACYPEP